MIHVDQQNCRRLGWRYVAVSSSMVVIDGTTYRLAVIGYSRRAIGDFMEKREVYSPVLRPIVDFVEGLPTTRREIGPHLLHQVTDFRQNAPPIQVPIHMNKMVFYSSYAFMLGKILQHEGMTRPVSPDNEVANAYLNTTVLTNDSAHYWHYGQHVLSKPPGYFGKVGWKIARAAATFFFKTRDEVKSGHLILPKGTRHQPHYNKHGPDGKYRTSIDQISSVRRHSDELVAAGKVKRAYAEVSDMCSKKVVGCGKLTSNHLICIGSMAGMLKTDLLTVAYIPETTATARRLKALSPRLCDDDWDKHSNEILTSLCTVLDCTMMSAEEGICLAFKDKKKRDDPVECVFPGQVIGFMEGKCLRAHVPGSANAVDVVHGIADVALPAAAATTNTVTTRTNHALAAPRIGGLPPNLTHFPRVVLSLGKYAGWCLFEDDHVVVPTLDLRMERVSTRPAPNGTTTSLTAVGRPSFHHVAAYRFCVIQRGNGSPTFVPDNFSEAAQLFDRCPAFVNNDHRFFCDKRTAVEYLLWSVILHPSNFTTLRNRIIPDILSRATSTDVNGRLLVAKGTNRVVGYITVTPDGSTYLRLLSKSRRPRGAEVKVPRSAAV